MVKTGIRCLGSLQLSFHYQEQRKCLKASLIMRHRQNCWGELADLKLPGGL